MRTFALLSLSLCALPAAAHADAAGATTQACLGDFATFLTCPTGASVQGSECRQREPLRGEGPGEHWSGSKRQGPALFFADDDVDDAQLDNSRRVHFAAYYKDHKKNGRVFDFDSQGRLSSWSDMADDDYHGLSVDCDATGHVRHVASFLHGKVVGVSRSWREDGSFAYAFEYDANSKMIGRVTPSVEQTRRPDELCHPARCDVTAKPDRSGLPKTHGPAATP